MTRQRRSQIYNEPEKKRKSFLRTFIPLLLILIIIFLGVTALIDKGLIPGIFSETPAELMADIEPMAGGDSDFSKEFSDVNRVNVLVLGENNKLTDTIMLASFDMDLKRVDVVSVPRDTYYERSEYSGAAYQKINSVYETEGIEGAATAVSNVLGGVPIHFYEMIGDDGVKNVVDAMGGIEIDVPMDMKYDDYSQDLHIDLKAGKQVLDGEHAVQYLRFRKGYPTGDIGRVGAQQEFVKEAFKQSIGFGFPKVAKTAMKELESNLATKMALRVASQAVGMETNDIETHMTPGAPETRNGASYFIVDRQGALEMMRMIYSMKAETTAGDAETSAGTEE